MRVLLLLAALSMIGFFIPKTKMKLYFCLGVVVLAGLYFFFVPPESYDLYRHFELMDTIRGMSYMEIFRSGWAGDSAQMADYMDSSKGYLVLLYLLTRFGPNELLPVLTVGAVYGLSAARIWKLGKEMDSSTAVMAITFTAVLFCIDFRNLSGIRNMLAYAIFAYVLYEDLVKKKNPVVCFALYLLLCGLHMSCIILVLLRLVVAISRVRLRRIFTVLMAGVFTVAGVVTDLLERYISNPFVDRFVYKVNVYRFEKREDFNLHGALVYAIIIVAFLVIYLDTTRRMESKKEYARYSEFYVYTVAFTLGAFQQYHILLRNSQLIVMLSVPYVMYFAKDYLMVEQGGRSLILGKDGARDSVILLGFFALLGASLLFYWWIAYLPIDGYFRF